MRLDLAAAAALDISVGGCALGWALPFLTRGEVASVEVALVPRTINEGGRYPFDYGCGTKLVSRRAIPPALLACAASTELKERHDGHPPRPHLEQHMVSDQLTASMAHFDVLPGQAATQ